MAEIETKIEEKTAPVVASAGKVQRVNTLAQQEEKVEEIAEKEVEEEKKVEVIVKAEAQTDDKKVEEGKEVEFTEEQKKAFFKKMGIEYKGDDDFEALKEKLKPTEAQPSEEDKKKAISAAELKQAELYIKNGGTLEQFNTIKSIANADPKEFSKKAAILELIDAGFTEEEAKDIAKERYYQIELDAIEQEVDETDEEFEARKAKLQKKIDFGTKKIQTKSSYLQKQAGDVIKGLQEALEYEELQKKTEAEFLSNVDKTLSTIPRKQTFELGKVNDREISPILHEVSDDSVAKVAELLKDPAKRNQFFYNQDNSLNIANLTPLLLNHFEMNRAIKGALLEGQTRQVAEFEKVFPSKTAFELGVGGTPRTNLQKGKVASSGKPQVVRPQYN
jgi:hypothetical protein